MDVTLGVITWNSRALLEQLLDSIYETVERLTFEIVVVDNGSTDGTLEMVKERFPEVVLVENSENLGVAKARNQLLKKSRGRYILSLDVDTTLTRKGAVETLVSIMDEHPEAAMGGPKLVYRDGTLQMSCKPFPSPLNILIEGTFLRNIFPNSRFVKDYTMEDWDHSHLREVDWLYGAALMIRTSALEEIGYLDDEFFYLYEDIDHCFQARKHGHKVLYIPEAEICHHCERGEDASIFAKTLWVHLRSIRRYLIKDYLKMVKMKALGKWPD